VAHDGLLKRAARLRTSQVRPFLVLGIDALIAAASFYLAMLLRFEGRITEPFLSLLPSFMLLLVCYRVLANTLFRLHRWSFLFSGLPDAARVGMAGLFGTGLFLGNRTKG
jgi:hypothetical protein